MHRVFCAFLLLTVVSCTTEPVVCTQDEDCLEGTFCYLEPRGPNDPEAPEGLDPHQAKYQDQGICRRDCVSDQDCRGTYRCTNRGLCKDLDNAADNRQYTPEYEPDPVSLRQAFESDKLLSCIGFINCYNTCNSSSETCRQSCANQTAPSARSQVGEILHCAQAICQIPQEESQVNYIECLRGSCPDVLEACGIP